MKTRIILAYAAAAFLSCGCVNMDITPKTQGTSGSWFSTETELQMAANEFYMIGYWNIPLESSEQWTDNVTYRNVNRNPQSGGTLLDATINGKQYEVYALWQQSYKLIARANTMLAYSHRALENGVREEIVDRFNGEAYFCRACKYSDLIFFFGDVPYMNGLLTIEQAEAMGRKPKAELIPLVYEDFDNAVKYLPQEWQGSQHATKGAALAMKARFALYMGDWATAAEAAKACMNLKAYSLASNYGSIFLQETGMIPEKVFVIPRSAENNVVIDSWVVNNGLPRNAGGYGSYNPSWDLLAAYLCTDGLPIDESPLFNPQEPFKNRDPRCTATIVEFGTEHCGFIYDPSPAATKVLNTTTGNEVPNNDSRAVAQYASYNGLIWKKGIDKSWADDRSTIDPDYIIMRYADVLLMYAEAKIELGEIDDSVLGAINQVRARAYGVSASTSFPAKVTTTDRDALRKAVRIERRMEFAMENLRLQDLMRWKLATKALNRYNYIYLYPASDCKAKLVDTGKWPWPATPDIDEDGLADFSPWAANGLVAIGAERIFPENQYLWPLPTYDMELCPNLRPDNPGY